MYGYTFYIIAGSNHGCDDTYDDMVYTDDAPVVDVNATNCCCMQ